MNAITNKSTWILRSCWEKRPFILAIPVPAMFERLGTAPSSASVIFVHAILLITEQYVRFEYIAIGVFS